METGSAPIPSYTLVSAEKLSTQNKEVPEESTEGERNEMGVVRFRISRSAVHDEFVPVQLFHKRLGTNVEGRRCLHCDQEFLNKNKTNLDDHLRVFHSDVYQRALGTGCPIALGPLCFLLFCQFLLYQNTKIW